MKLHSGDVRSLHDGGERLAVLSHRDGFTHQRRDITVCEVHLRLIGHALQDRSLALQGKGVPPDVWNLDLRVRLKADTTYRGIGDRALVRSVRLQPDLSALDPEAMALARQQAKPRQIGCLVASLEQPVHAEADAEQGPAFANAPEDALDPSAVERSRRAEMSDARDDDAARLAKRIRSFRHEHVGADRRQRLLDGRQVSGLVIDQRDHSRPFVLGSMRASRLSFAHATRSARPNALKTASILWWLERPYRTLTCTFALAPIAKPSKKSCTSSVWRSPTRAAGT